MEKYIEKVFSDLKIQPSSKGCIYFTVFNGYDRLKIPENLGLDVYLFTDDEKCDLSNAVVTGLLNNCPIKSNRAFKFYAFHYLFDYYDYVIYSDSNVRWLENIKSLNKPEAGLLFFTHNKRNYLSEEIEECLKYGKITKEQEKKFKTLSEYNPKARLLLGSVFFVRKSSALYRISRKWEQYYNIAHRDQLGLALLYEEFRPEFTKIDFDVSTQYFTRVPHLKVPRISLEKPIWDRFMITIKYKLLKLIKTKS